MKLVSPGGVAAVAARMSASPAAVFRRFWRDESAQDLVEYAYLSALVGLTGAAVWSAIVQLVGARYNDYDGAEGAVGGVQNLWDPPAP